MIEKKAALFGIALSIAGIFLLYSFSEAIEPPAIPISQISLQDEGNPITTSGTLIDLNEKEKVTLLTLRDGNSSILVPIFTNPPPNLNVGDTIKVSGKVVLYNGKLEILPANQNSVKLESSSLEFISISQITSSWRYRQVHVLGKVDSTREYATGQLIKIQDHSGSIPIFNRRAQELWAGDLIEVDGMVDLYKGELQIKASSVEKL
ncbi:hypothetical protein ACFLQI_02750 [Candidatus Undinarchaeota archaeon]